MTDVETTSRGLTTTGPTEEVTYWYGDEPTDRRRRSKAVLEALRIYRAAEVAMRRRTRDSMSMGRTSSSSCATCCATPPAGCARAS